MTTFNRSTLAFAVFSMALLASTISAGAMPTNGLVSYWKANNNTQDSVDGNHGQLMNGVTYGPGFESQAFVFDGVDDYVQIGNPANLGFTDNFTLTAWIHPTGNGATEQGGIIINKEGAYEFARFQNGNIYWAFNTVDPGNPARPGDPLWDWYDTGIQIPLNRWSHIAISFSNGTVKSYLNGVLQHVYQGTGARVANRYNDLQDFRIGGRQLNGGIQYFEGLIDEIAVFNRVLSDEEISQLVHPDQSVSSVPTTSAWGLLMLSALLVGIALRRRHQSDKD